MVAPLLIVPRTASASTSETEAAVVLPLESHAPIAPETKALPQKRPKARRREDVVGSIGDSGMYRHPVAGLPWLQRRPLSDLSVIPASHIRFRVHVSPAFAVDDGEISEDGFILNHGVFNYGGLRSEVRPS